MTIGSTYNHPADVATPLAGNAEGWSARFPNPPDLCFDYRRLLEQVGGIAQARRAEHRICIIGAGVTGLTAARELLRCGFQHITLIEKSQRIGGRHMTIVDPGPGDREPSTPFEMGAMRMPLFNRSGEAPKEGRSLMAYYASQFDLRLSDFPNPGTPAVRSTGIYLREGLLDGEGEPTLLIWDNADGRTPPPTATLQQVHEKWRVFADRMTETVAQAYGDEQWEDLWAAAGRGFTHGGACAYDDQIGWLQTTGHLVKVGYPGRHTGHGHMRGSAQDAGSVPYGCVRRVPGAGVSNRR